MTSIVEPTQAQLDKLVAPYLKAQPSGLGFAIGYASPSFPNYGSIYFAGSVQNQFGTALTLDGSTLFEIASVSKTFTAMLYSLLIRRQSSALTLGNFIYPNGPLRISSSLAEIPLDGLMNYTSGLPQDNVDRPVDTPPYWQQPHIVHHPPFHKPWTARILPQKVELGQKRRVRREASALGWRPLK